MKRFCALCLSVLLLAAGCGRAAEDVSGSIGLSIATRDRFLTMLEQSVRDAALELGVTCHAANANNDQAVQLSQVRDWSRQGYGAAVVVLCENGSAAAVQKAAGDMPVVFVNRAPDDLSLLDGVRAAYVGSREQDAGRLQGEFLAAHFQKAGNLSPVVAVISASPAHTAAAARVQGAKQAMEQAGLSPAYVLGASADWDANKAHDVFSAFLDTGETYDAVLAVNDETALGAIRAMHEHGMAQISVPVAGVDGTMAACAAVSEGAMAFTVFQDPAAQGKGAVQAAAAMMDGRDPEGFEDGVLWVPFSPVTAENVQDYLS